MPIEWTEDGPEGEEKIEFSANGVRLAVLGDDGIVVEEEQRSLNCSAGFYRLSATTLPPCGPIVAREGSKSQRALPCHRPVLRRCRRIQSGAP